MNGLISNDELNVMSERLRADFALPPEERKRIVKDRIDEILDILIMQYIYGNEDANEMLGVNVDWSEQIDIEFSGSYPPGTEPYRVDTSRMESVINQIVADKTWRQRVEDWYASDNGTPDDIIRIIETESHRVYNDSILDVGEQADKETGGVYKTWFTMLDDRVRDSHVPLEGVTVPYHERFYTFDNDSAMAPGGFSDPKNNIGCRCSIWLTR
jgi:hypothetical protein